MALRLAVRVRQRVRVHAGVGCRRRAQLHTTAAPGTRVVERREVEPGIVEVRLNRPAKYNALDRAMFDEIAGMALALRAEKGLRAVVLSGAGKAFCSGLDVKSMAKSNPVAAKAHLLGKREPGLASNRVQDVGYLWRQVPVPIIAAVHGYCYGGGLQLALGADIRVSSPDCKFSVMEARYGLIPDMSASVTLRELVRIDVAKELAFTGRVVPAEEARELGLVTHLDEDPVARALAIARLCKERSPDSVAANKLLLQSTWVASEERCLAEEERLQLQLLPSWNMVASTLGSFRIPLPFIGRNDSLADGGLGAGDGDGAAGKQ